MTDPKGNQPPSDHPDEDHLHLEQHQEGEAPILPEEALPLEEANLHASTEEFQFAGPPEELDFSEPTDFAFPTEAPAEDEAAEAVEAAEGEPVAEYAETEFVAGDEAPVDEAAEPGEVPAEAAADDEGIANLDLADEAADEESPRPEWQLPAWVYVVEWTAIGTFTAFSILGLIIAAVWVENPDHATIVLNICCPLMLVMIPYALWRSSKRWVAPAASAIYTLMLALSVFALICGTWLQGMELAGYKWQYTKGRVQKGKPRPVVVAPITDAAPQPAADSGAAPAADAEKAQPADSAAPAK